MGSDLFKFKRFDVYQSRSAMKVGTDGVLLGSWVGVNANDQEIMDIGCGTGLISLMVAQRSPSANISAIEIEQGAAIEALENTAHSPWAERISVFHCPFQDFPQGDKQDKKFDLIVTNPPYFDGTYSATGKNRNTARHSDRLTDEDIIDGVCRMLKNEDSRFAVIYPNRPGVSFIAKALGAGLYLNRLCYVIPKEGRLPKRIMMEFSFRFYQIKQEKLVILDENGQYSEQYRELTKDFYLRF